MSNNTRGKGFGKGGRLWRDKPIEQIELEQRIKVDAELGLNIASLGCTVRFVRYRGVTYAFDHEPGYAPDGTLKRAIKPVRQCSQWGDSAKRGIMQAALNDLDGEEDGLWVFPGPQKTWHRVDLTLQIMDILEVAKDTRHPVQAFLENNLHRLDSGETYDALVALRLITPCPTSITSSCLGAINFAFQGNTQMANFSYYSAINLKGLGDSEKRGKWLKEEVKRLTGYDLIPIKMELSENTVVFDVEFKGGMEL